MELEEKQVKIVRISKNALVEAAGELSGEAFKLFVLFSALHIDGEELTKLCNSAEFCHALSELVDKNYAFKNGETEDVVRFPNIAYDEEFAPGLFLKSGDKRQVS